MKRSRDNQRRFSNLENLEHRTLLTTTGFELPAAEPIQAEVASQDTGETQRVQRIVNGTQTSDYKAVGIVNGQCSGTLIAPNVVLTAAHCIPEDASASQDFEVEGQRYAAERVVVHPQVDLAVMVLKSDVPGITPIEINRVAPQVGQMLTLVGYGATGTAQNGHNGSFGVKHVGQTPIDEVTSTEVNWRFDNANESNTAPGDSGGAAFLTINGKLVLAGVTSGGTLESAGLGDYSFDVRVDAFADWIDDAIAGGGTDVQPGIPSNPDDGLGDGDFDDDDFGIDDGFGDDDFDMGIGDDQDFGVDDLKEFAQQELDEYDRNGDDKLSRRELIDEFMDFGDSRRDAADLADYLIETFDADGDNKLNLDELTASYGLPGDDFSDEPFDDLEGDEGLGQDLPGEEDNLDLDLDEGGDLDDGPWQDWDLDNGDLGDDLDLELDDESEGDLGDSDLGDNEFWDDGADLDLELDPDAVGGESENELDDDFGDINDFWLDHSWNNENVDVESCWFNPPAEDDADYVFADSVDWDWI